jgi:hypothetical protein
LQQFFNFQSRCFLSATKNPINPKLVGADSKIILPEHIRNLAADNGLNSVSVPLHAPGMTLTDSHGISRTTRTAPDAQDAMIMQTRGETAQAWFKNTRQLNNRVGAILLQHPDYFQIFFTYLTDVSVRMASVSTVGVNRSYLVILSLLVPGVS